MTSIFGPSERRTPVTYKAGYPVDQSSFFNIVPPDKRVENYLQAPGYEIGRLRPGRVLIITGRNPDKTEAGPGYFDQTVALWRDGSDLCGQFIMPPGTKEDPEEFTIGSIHSSIDPQDGLSEAGPQRIKLGFFLQADYLRFSDGSEAANITMAGRVICCRVIDMPRDTSAIQDNHGTL